MCAGRVVHGCIFALPSGSTRINWTCPFLGNCICSCCAAIFSTRAGVAHVLCSNCNCPHSTSICCACSFSLCNLINSLRALCCEVTTLSAHTTTAASSNTFNPPSLRHIATLRHAHHRATCTRVDPHFLLRRT